MFDFLSSLPVVKVTFNDVNNLGISKTDHFFDGIYCFIHSHVLSDFDSVNSLSNLNLDHKKNTKVFQKIFFPQLIPFLD
jgi:hypothetical protein